MEIIVVLRDIGENTETIRYSQSHHVFGVQQGRYSQLLLRNLERQLIVLINIFFAQGVKVYQVRSVFVNQSAKRQAVPKRRGHVGDRNITISIALDFAPLLKSFHSSHRCQCVSKRVVYAKLVSMRLVHTANVKRFWFSLSNAER